MSVYFRHSLIFTPVMRIIAHVLSTLRKLRAEQVNLLCRDVAMSQIATGKKKTMNQGFTTTEPGIIGRNC